MTTNQLNRILIPRAIMTLALKARRAATMLLLMLLTTATAWADDSGDCGDGVTSIGDWAFQGCTSLLSIEIPASVTGIGNYAFALSAATSVRCCKHQILRVEL